MSVGDADNDGDIDIVISYAEDGAIYYHANDGTGIFGERQRIDGTIHGVRAVGFADLNGDGALDIYAASPLTGVVRWYANDGDAVFGSGTNIATPNTVPNDVIAVDLDGDGDNDLIAADPVNDAITWFSNNGVGVFGSAQTITSSLDSAEQVHCADIDMDGDMDVLGVSATNGSLAWYPNLGGGNFGGGQMVPSILSYPFLFDIHDLDGDGAQDIVAPGGGVTWFKNNGFGNFTPRMIGVDYSVGIAQAGDFDNDGLPEIYVEQVDENFYHTLVVVALDSLGDAGSTWQIDAIANTTALSIVDMDHADRLDFLVASGDWDKVAWYQNPDSSIDPSSNDHIVDAQASTFSDAPYIIDMDGDGDPDIATKSLFDRTIWFQNNGSASFDLRSTPVLGPWDTDQLVAGDLNGDGAGDFLGKYYYTLVQFGVNPDLHALLNDGSGVHFDTTEVAPVTSSSTVKTLLIDLDMDGDLDVLNFTAWNVPDQTISWRENDGTGHGWTVHSIISTSYDQELAFFSAAVADMNGDGWLDIIAASTLTHHVEILFGTGLGTWAVYPVIVYTLATQSFFATPLDMNGDGLMDIVAQDLSVDPPELVTLQQDVNNEFTLHQDLQVNSYGFCLKATDVDDDGDVDLIYPSPWGSRVSMFMNDGLGTLGPEVVISDQDLEQPEWLVLGDLDSDGDKDLVVSDYIGQRLVWFKNMGSPLAESELATERISVHPNPFSEWTTVTMGNVIGPSDILELTSADGRMVRTIRGNGSKEATFSREGLASGIYSVRVVSDDIVMGRARVVVQ